MYKRQVEAVLRAVELRGSHTVNVAGPEVTTLRSLASLLGAKDFEEGDSAPDIVASTERMEELLGAPTVGVAEGVERTLAQS